MNTPTYLYAQITGSTVSTAGGRYTKKPYLANSDIHDDIHDTASDATEPLTLTVVEAAKLLGVSKAFAYELVTRGELPSIHLGRRIVIPRVALMALINGQL